MGEALQHDAHRPAAYVNFAGALAERLDVQEAASPSQDVRSYRFASAGGRPRPVSRYTAKVPSQWSPS